MNTDTLIASLNVGLRPVANGAVERRLAAGVAIGVVVAVVVLSLTLGFRPDIWLAMQGPTFWMKWGYSISLSAAAIFVVSRLARPDPGRLRSLWLLGVPVLVLAGIGIAELARTPRDEWLAMWLGKTWMVCPWLVLALSGPIFVGLLWSFRKLAPTRLRAAGAAAGLSAGAFAATVYCLHCPEVSAIFVLTWYSLGMLLTAAVGALVGPRLLRW